MRMTHWEHFPHDADIGGRHPYEKTGIEKKEGLPCAFATVNMPLICWPSS
jgi:hypothetical protein